MQTSYPWVDAFDAILFDFDGLLVDTETLHFEAYKEALAMRGYILDWDFKRYQQAIHVERPTLSKDVYALFPQLKKEQPDWMIVRGEKQVIYAQLLQSRPLHLLPGAEALIKFLSSINKPRAIVTNSDRKQIEMIAKKLPALYEIPLWITRQDYRNPKPHPDPYLKAVEMLDLEGKKSVAFEDTLKGIESLKGTSLQPVLICLSDHPQLEGYKGEFPHFTSFNALIDQERL